MSSPKRVLNDLLNGIFLKKLAKPTIFTESRILEDSHAEFHFSFTKLGEKTLPICLGACNSYAYSYREQK